MTQGFGFPSVTQRALLAVSFRQYLACGQAPPRPEPAGSAARDVGEGRGERGAGRRPKRRETPLLVFSLDVSRARFALVNPLSPSPEELGNILAKGLCRHGFPTPCLHELLWIVCRIIHLQTVRNSPIQPLAGSGEPCPALMLEGHVLDHVDPCAETTPSWGTASQCYWERMPESWHRRVRSGVHYPWHYRPKA